MQIDPHIGEWFGLLKDGTIIVAVVGSAIRITQRFDRISGILKDFPPHRHVNDNVSYPEGYDPPKTEKLYSTVAGGQ